ncbi:hypothetical protein MMC27_006091 [Xylographa pallens]|nr:hypothetical protein [Xylographa pallens]
MERLPRRFVTDRRYIWDRAFATRQWRSHALEVSLIEPQPHESIVDAFISGQKSLLDPPQYNCPALKSFLDSASTAALLQIPARPANAAKIALIDDRRDHTGWQAGGEHRGARDWDGYDRYPPEGVDQYFSAVTAAELHARLKVNRQDAGAERRVIYIANMTPLCALAMAATVPALRIAVLREFLQRYVVYSVSFGVSFPFFGFALEFHIPYYALRESIEPSRDTRGLRNCGKLPANLSNPLRPEYIYEAQISVMVTGIDEWFWTAYCCVDTYFGSEQGVEVYHDSTLDAATGGERLISQPAWNPREYFLYMLSRRFRQATKEWRVIVGVVENRLQTHEATIFHVTTRQAPLSDDIKFNRTREYTSTIELLRLLCNAVIKFIESWERFEAGELLYFHVEEQAILQKKWDGYLADIVKDSNELRSLRTTLRQKIETFDNMKSGLVNVSAMVESRVATDQGKNIGRLTRVTVVSFLSESHEGFD